MHNTHIHQERLQVKATHRGKKLFLVYKIGWIKYDMLEKQPLQPYVGCLLQTWMNLYLSMNKWQSEMKSLQGKWPDYIDV